MRKRKTKGLSLSKGVTGDRFVAGVDKKGDGKNFVEKKKELSLYTLWEIGVFRPAARLRVILLSSGLKRGHGRRGRRELCEPLLDSKT